MTTNQPTPHPAALAHLDFMIEGEASGLAGMLDSLEDVIKSARRNLARGSGTRTSALDGNDAKAMADAIACAQRLAALREVRRAYDDR